MKTTEQHSNVVVRYIFLTVGAISFVLGTAGIVIPLFPTVPFYMLTLFCLARGSERFHNMFLESSLYQKTVGAYERDKALTLRTKLSILLSVSTISTWSYTSSLFKGTSKLTAILVAYGISNF